MILQGSYVRHAKMPDLGIGEVLSVDDGKVGIRFESGERRFMYDLVEPYLTVTDDAPPPPPKKKPAKRAAKTAAAKR